MKQRVFIVGIICVIVLFSSSCLRNNNTVDFSQDSSNDLTTQASPPRDTDLSTTNDTSSPVSDHYYIEAVLDVPDAVGCYARGRPILFALVREQEYILVCSAEKWMENIDAKMKINIILPPNLEIISGATTWLGTDRQKTFELKVKAITTGESEIAIEATNLINGYSLKYIAEVTIANTVEEAKNIIDELEQKYLNPQPGKME